MTDMGADKSEQLAEPGIMIPFEFGLHSKLRLANSVLIKGEWQASLTSLYLI